jgi:hypothetical protein
MRYEAPPRDDHYPRNLDSRDISRKPLLFRIDAQAPAAPADDAAGRAAGVKASKARPLDTGDRVYLESALREGSNWAALGDVMRATGFEPAPALALLEDLRRELRIRRPWTLPADRARVRVFAMMDFPAAMRYADGLRVARVRPCGDRVRAGTRAQPRRARDHRHVRSLHQAVRQCRCRKA